MTTFIKKYKEKILKITLALASLFILSILILILLIATNIIYIEDGLQINLELFDNFRNSWYGIIIYILAQCIITSFLCAIPGASMAFIMLSTVVFSNPWKAFILSYIGVVLSSVLMYYIGKTGGYKICCKILGEEDCEKSVALVRDKGSIYFPIMMLFPIFPDDALVMIAGTTKMSMKWFIPSILLGRGAGIATIVFGISIVPFDKFEGLYDWIVFITVCAFWIIMIFKLAHKVNAWMDKKRKNKQN